ncbi:MAG TPA: ATPase, T2SS/T4P/T4SS family [Tepidisphaeraceae bacterium]|jgi:general secretion pathway protein E/type IV pilus assembly protein PilB|nr:ATPase, T2SS/T4P/T4SS family [Tepidisphaeraceae bacterium]
MKMEAVLSRLISEGLLDDAGAKRVRTLLSEGKLLDEAILAADGVSEDKMLRLLGSVFDIPYVELEPLTLSKEFLSKFPARVLIQHHILPIDEQHGIVSVATSKVFDLTPLDELRLACGRDVRPVLAPASEIDRCMKRFLGVGADTLQTLVSDAQGDVQVIDSRDDEDLDLANAAQDASIIKFVNQVLTEAIELRATDVHVEPFEDQLRVRYRVDGELQQANIPPEVRRFQAAIVSRLKILSHLDIAEKRLPQDGRIKLKIAGREIDVRVSIIPMLHGEAVVLRILDRNDALLGTQYLGMAERDRNAFDTILELPHGIVLVTGPTGSGKTTTLYAALSKINDIQRKIITIEDPVEYQLRGINQIQVSTKAGLTFALGLRSILRHDPDVVLVGEIRDMETAEIAVQASLTGHLVFSTLHTNDAPSAATRLVDMGLEPYLVASSLEVVVAQRLVRLICKECKEQAPQADVDLLRSEFHDLVPQKLYRGRGCRNCQNTGYRGRTGIFELMLCNDEIRSLVLERAPSHEIRKVAIKDGMRNLREDGWRLVAEGRTTIEEVFRNTKDEAMHLHKDGPKAPATAGAQQ